MIDINSSTGLDNDTNYNCAYHFPAIALTLGPSNWNYIRDLYKQLADERNWKVRQTLAYSIHQMAKILGEEKTQSDLVPIFDNFITDVDEVRIGIVANMAEFFRILTANYREAYMPRLTDFLKMDNQRNWRFRNELGLQIAEFCELFSRDTIAKYIQPVVFTLAFDQIAQVRVTAIDALVQIFKQFEFNGETELRRNFVNDVTRSFADSSKWTFRQLYVYLCESLLKNKIYTDLDQFTRDFIVKLLTFRDDKVPNIRVLLARIIKNLILPLGNLLIYDNQCFKRLN
jgi:serine/threonine-protein phosphatase 4 regulatory subunit 1